MTERNGEATTVIMNFLCKINIGARARSKDKVLLITVFAVRKEMGNNKLRMKVGRFKKTA